MSDTGLPYDAYATELQQNFEAWVAPIQTSVGMINCVASVDTSTEGGTIATLKGTANNVPTFVRVSLQRSENDTAILHTTISKQTSSEPAYQTRATPTNQPLVSRSVE